MITLNVEEIKKGIKVPVHVLAKTIASEKFVLSVASSNKDNSIFFANFEHEKQDHPNLVVGIIQGENILFLKSVGEKVKFSIVSQRKVIQRLLTAFVDTHSPKEVVNTLQNHPVSFTNFFELVKSPFITNKVYNQALKGIPFSSIHYLKTEININF